MPILSDEDRDRLYLLVRDGGPLVDKTWKEALTTLLPAYRLGLPDRGDPDVGTLLATVVALNTAGRRIDGSVPLEVTLTTLSLVSTDTAVM